MFQNPLLEMLRSRPPQTVALVTKKSSLSTGELLEKSERLAAALQQQGAKAGDTAVLAAQPGPDFVAIVYAAMLLGLRLAVIDPEMGRDNYREKLGQLKARWAFVDSRLLLLQEHPVLRWLYFRFSKKGMYFPRQSGLRIISTGPWMPIVQRTLALQTLFKQVAGGKNEESMPGDNEFMITYTSGTTSVPKGVVHTIGGIIGSIQQISNLLRQGHNTRLATHLPYFAIIGLNAGVEAWLWDYNSSAADKIRFIEQNRISTLFAPPCDYLPMMQYCEFNNRLLPDCLQQLFFGSAPVYRSFLERLIPLLPDHVQLSCLYGMTENLVVCAIDGREKAQLPVDQGDYVGKPVPGVELQFADDGEIMLRSDQLYKRYLHLETRDAFHATGDLGKLDSEGRLLLTGRKKDMIIRRNFNLYPGLYEPTINRIPGVVEAAFVGVYDEKIHDEVVILFVESSIPMDEQKLRKALEFGPYSIDREAWPDRIVFKTLPRKGRQSKVDKVALRNGF